MPGVTQTHVGPPYTYTPHEDEPLMAHKTMQHRAEFG